jgi:hypothetical protein
VSPATSRRKGQEQQWSATVAMPDLPRPQEPLRLYQRKAMKTKHEIKEEIIELYATQKAFGEAMEFAHQQQMDAMKKMMALNHMLKEMEDGNE